MKRVLQRSWIVFIVAIAFLCGLGFLVFKTVTNAADWASKPYNGHISNLGKITDRNGNILAKTVDGERVYNNDPSVRKSLLHVVGDETLNISTALQSRYRSELSGYNFIWGMNMPKSFRGSGNVQLTVDADTCKAAYDVLKNYDSGACVVYNYETGEVICSVSTKSYDPQAPPKITEENEDLYRGVYIDNVLSSSYTPGSIFKIVTSVAAIENIPDIWERTWYCGGKEEIGGSDVTCVSSHGTVNLEQAFGHSCNIVFAELAVELGKEKMNEAAEKLGINASFEVSGINTKKGNYNVKKANTNQLAWSGVGQYEDKVNPMQMAIICGAVARGGTPITPYIVSGDSGNVIADLGLSKAGATGEKMLSKETANSIDKLMRSAVVNDYGDYMFGGLTVCAKTGTGETVTGEGENLNDGWMVGYSKDEDCPLAFAAVVHRSSQYGYATAGQVAKAAMIQAAKSLRAE